MDIITLRGNHLSIMAEPYVQELALKIRKCSDKASQPSPDPPRSPGSVNVAFEHANPKIDSAPCTRVEG